MKYPINPTWLQGMPRWLSPNHNARPLNSIVDTVVMHNISLPPESFNSVWVRRLFTNQLANYQAYHPYFMGIAQLRVSAHFYISRRGRVIQCVSLHRRAWHAGQSYLLTPQGMRHNLNDTSVGIELAGSDTVPFTDIQYTALYRLLRRLNQLLPLQYIVGHSDIAPLRKTDPGPYFDWSKVKAHIPIHLKIFKDIKD